MVASRSARVRSDARSVPAPGSLSSRARTSLTIHASDVSRQHAEIYREADGPWHVRDLGSDNGVFAKSGAGKSYFVKLEEFVAAIVLGHQQDVAGRRQAAAKGLGLEADLAADGDPRQLVEALGVGATARAKLIGLACRGPLFFFRRRGPPARPRARAS